ncbi:MAG: PepSY domain-containing protein [Candidatus Caldarchaeum sp.]
MRNVVLTAGLLASAALAALVAAYAWPFMQQPPAMFWLQSPNRNIYGGGMHGGMMGGCPCTGWYGGAPQSTGQRITLQEAQEILERYVNGLGQGFRLKEVMEFQQNFYAIVVEADTGRGAFELLVNPYTGAVHPEPGPNMMWNTKYGMHNGMMGPYIQPTVDMPITQEQAEEIALNYLRNRFRADLEVEHPTKFYGYYTMDYKLDDKIHGMLSVNGFTGQVWYHSWHGQFIQEIDMEEE